MSEFAMTVREMDARDIASALKIQNASRFETWKEKTFRDLLEKTYTFAYVAEAPDDSGVWKIAGYAVFSLAADEAELLAIATSPEFLRKGIATELFAEGEEALADAGARTFYLEVREENGTAIAFYRKLGFEKCGRRDAYYADGENAVLMSRPL